MDCNTCFYCEQNKTFKGYADYADISENYRIFPKTLYEFNSQVFYILKRIYMYNCHAEEIKLIKLHFYYSSTCDSCVEFKNKLNGIDTDQMPHYKTN